MSRGAQESALVIVDSYIIYTDIIGTASFKYKLN